MANVKRETTITVFVIAEEIKTILKQYLATQKNGAIVVPSDAAFDMSVDGAIFKWTEVKER